MNDFTTDLEKHLTRLGKEINHFVERLSMDEDQEAAFHPKADVLDSQDELLILIDLPGMTKKDIQLALKDGVLTVKGERSSPVQEHVSFKRKERPVGMFSRSFHLTEDADVAKIQAKFTNGVLNISIPKSETLKNATSIPIK